MIDSIDGVEDVTLDSTENSLEDNDTSFLEAKRQEEDFFAIEPDYFETLSTIASKPAFIPSLHDSVFEQPLNHAMWTSSSWPEPTRHFPN